MLALAMALVHEPAILLIDELSLGLAPIVVDRVLDVVRTMQAAGTFLVIVEQSLDIAVSIADRALFLERGRVRFDGSTAELMDAGTSPAPCSWGTDAGLRDPAQVVFKARSPASLRLGRGGPDPRLPDESGHQPGDGRARWLRGRVLAYLVVDQHVSYWVALPLCVAIGAAAGPLVELVVVRRLSNASRLLVARGHHRRGADPAVRSGDASEADGGRAYRHRSPRAGRSAAVRPGRALAIHVVMPALCLALAWFLARTRAACSPAPCAATLPGGSGIHVRRTSTAVWALRPFTALATILAAPFTTSTSSQVITLGSGCWSGCSRGADRRMSSLPGALAGGVLIGIIDSWCLNAPTNRGLTDLILFLVVVVVLLALSRRPDGDGSADWSFAPRSRTRAALGGEHGLVAGCRPSARSWRSAWLCSMVFADTANEESSGPGRGLRDGRPVAHGADGWTGQLSIGQFAFVGLGAMTATSMITPTSGRGRPSSPRRWSARCGGDRRRPGASPAGPVLAVSTLALGVMRRRGCCRATCSSR